MPQLIPFYFINQISWGFLIFTILFIIFSTFFLPNIKSKMLGRIKLLIK